MIPDKLIDQKKLNPVVENLDLRAMQNPRN